MSHTNAIVLFMILYVSTVAASITFGDFDNFHYDRICNNTNKKHVNDICRRIAKLDPANAHPNIDTNVDGVCQSVGVQLYNDAPGIGKNITPKAVIGLCDIGPRSYKKCASASKEKNQVEYFDYNSDGDCIHVGSITLDYTL